MKKVIVILAVLAMAGHALGAIGGSKHDFSGLGWNAAGEICNVCHTPHSPTNANSDAPLWDHESTTTVTLIPYSSGTLTATDLATAPQGVTKLCLSCHDGTIDLDDFGGNVGTNKIAVGFQVGADGDLTGEHPVSFTYDDALATADGGLHPPTTTLSNLPGGGFIDDDLLAGATELECSSCHDVHDADSNPSLLVIDNANSALCLTCHDK
jgi:predicted CXXCH cytochrome family protein